MSSSVFARADRHRFLGLLLRIRASVYLLAGAPFLVFGQVGTAVAVVGLIAVVLIAGMPFILRRVGAGTGLRSSAVIDVAVAYALWLSVPAADSITLLLVVWTVAVTVLLSSPSQGARFVLLAAVAELSKVLVLILAPGLIASTPDDLGWVILGRTIIIIASYLVWLVIDRYLVTLSMAAETGSERYRRLMDGAPAAFLVVKADTVAYANAAACELLGHGERELLGSSFSGMVDPDQRGRLSERIRRAIEQLEPVEYESLRLEAVPGAERFVNVTVTAIDYAQEIAIQVALHDVSAQLRAETELAAAKLNYRAFFHRIPVALYRSRPDGEIIEANRALVQLLGARSESDLIGRNAKSFYLDEADRKELRSILDDQRIVVGFEAQLSRVDGSMIWVRDTARLIDTDIGGVYEGAMVDVTARRSIEDELWSRAMQQEAAASIGQMALEVEDMEDVVRSICETVARVLQTEAAVVFERSQVGGYTLIGSNLGADLGADAVAGLADRAHMTAAPVVLRAQEETELVAPDLAAQGFVSGVAVIVPGSGIPLGTLAALSRSARVFTSDDLNFLHSVASVLAAAVDRSQAHEQLEELLRSKDDFVASVSHELRTPLTVVTGMAHELRERWDELEDIEVSEYTKLLVEQSQDMADLIEDLLVAARANIGSVSVVNQPMQLDTQVEGVLSSISMPSPKSVDVHLEPGFVDADPIRVRQILRNLLTNAIRYGGDSIAVRMSSTQGTRSVEVIDDGPGIPDADRERIFDAYERAHDAKGQPGSVGLGLTVSRTLAELMGGSLTYHYDTESVFRLELSRDTEMEADVLVDPTAEPTPIRTVGAARIGVDVGLVE